MRIKYYSDVHKQKEKQGKGLTTFGDPKGQLKNFDLILLQFVHFVKF